MRAVWMTEFGGPEVLEVRETPDPVPGPGQVVVDVAFANITFVETMFRANGFGPFKSEPPLIPGNGVGGSLDNRWVVATTGGLGGYAERVSVDTENVIVVPEGLRLDDAVALMADGRTALWLTEAASLQPGERVLIEAAAGGVGSLLVQLVTAVGARVVGAAGGPDKVKVVGELGAEVAVDYRDPDWTTQVREGVGAVDVVFDGVGGTVADASFGLLETGGRMLTYGASSGDWSGVTPELAAEHGVTLVEPARPTPAELRAFTERALEEAAAGRLRPLIGQRFPLEQAAEAHAAIESRATIGKTLLEI